MARGIVGDIVHPAADGKRIQLFTRLRIEDINRPASLLCRGNPTYSLWLASFRPAAMFFLHFVTGQVVTSSCLLRSTTAIRLRSIRST